jgi:hypothetical protein
MAATYNLISSQVLGSTASTVTFSSIPQTYSDLKLVYSYRDSNSSGVGIGNQYAYFNTQTGTLFSYICLYAYASSAGGTKNSNYGWLTFDLQPQTNGSTANTFDSGELYIPNYTSSSSIQTLSLSTSESNTTTVAITALAQLYRGSAPITSITLGTNGSDNYLTNSSFYLYGIKNS